ncbi:EAL domain-containing protein [Planktotalea sp.]|uniref:EAL domain-containing protein n=1 Tax=Planktotalea sp. TaxID=2029877 RepID=UPI003D6C01BD
MIWGPHILAFLPAICLGAYWLVGEGGLIACALGLPLLWAMTIGFDDAKVASDAGIDAQPPSENFGEIDLTSLLSHAKPTDRIALFAIAIDDAPEHLKHLNGTDLQQVQNALQHRYSTILREHDIVQRSGPLSWQVANKPTSNLDLEACVQQASRLQSAVDEPFFIGNDPLYLSSCIGFTLAQTSSANPQALSRQAQSALQEATLNGPDAIRAFAKSQSVSLPAKNHSSLSDLCGTLDTNLVAFFQPQVSTDTGQVCGFEALARWKTDADQWLAPGIFLPILEKAGQMERLSDVMLSQSLLALREWDSAGLEIETVGVNYSESDLANPRIYEKIAWDLDRHDIAPHRLCIEILESVVADNSNDMIVRNVARLAELGCRIDLDDFGTGHASISTLRKLPVGRLKIDRSFVAKADLDSEQQKMVATILMMADRLGLSCLAEGVETLGEHTILAQLGCRYVQGFGIAKPMPIEQTIPWIRDYQGRRTSVPKIGRKTG